MQKYMMNEQGFVTSALLIIGVSLVGLGGWYVYANNQTNDDGLSNTDSLNLLENTTEETTNAPKSIVSTFTNQSGNSSISFTHPSDWTIKRIDEPSQKEISITSNNGNTLRVGNYGVGGSCDDDQLEYAVVEKIETATSGLFLTEYSHQSSDSSPYSFLNFEFLDGPNTDLAHSGLAVNETNNNVCGNLYYHGWLDAGIVSIHKTGPSNRIGSNVNFQEISESDTEFTKMLISAELSEKQ